MTEKDPNHWLYRFTSDEWLRAATNELTQSQQAFVGKSQREAVAHARRAAGMAVNALLWHRPDEAYGRSFMDHLVRLKSDESVPPPIQQAAQALVAMPLVAQLVQLGAKGDPRQAEPAERILTWAQQIVATYVVGN